MRDRRGPDQFHRWLVFWYNCWLQSSHATADDRPAVPESGQLDRRSVPPRRGRHQRSSHPQHQQNRDQQNKAQPKTEQAKNGEDKEALNDLDQGFLVGDRKETSATEEVKAKPEVKVEVKAEAEEEVKKPKTVRKPRKTAVASKDKSEQAS